MATQTVQTAAVEMDRPRTLRLDMNALATAEDLTGRNFLTSAAWRDLGVREVRALLFACLKDEDPALTLEDVGRHLHLGNLGDVIALLMGLYRAEGPQPGGDEEEGDSDEDAPLGVKVAARIPQHP